MILPLLCNCFVDGIAVFVGINCSARWLGAGAKKDTDSTFCPVVFFALTFVPMRIRVLCRAYFSAFWSVCALKQRVTVIFYIPLHIHYYIIGIYIIIRYI